MAARIGTALLTLALTACVPHAGSKSFEKRLGAPPGGRLTVETDLGSIAINGHDTAEVVVRVSMRGTQSFVDRLSIAAEQDSSGVRVTGRNGSRGWLGWLEYLQRRQVEFTVDVPRDYAVEIKTGGGSIDVHNLHGAVHGSTAGGSINIADVVGSVNARTGGGGIALKNIVGSVNTSTGGGAVDAQHLEGGPVEISSFGGGIDVSDATGALNVRTTGGSIQLKQIDGRVQARTGGGRVEAQMRSNQGISLDSAGGSVTLLLPPAVRGSVEARTRGGEVKSDLRLTGTEISEKSHLRGAINGGGEQIYLHTAGGGIYVGPLRAQ